MNDETYLILEERAIRSIIAQAYRSRLRDGLMFEITYLCGLRVCDLVNLDRTDYRRGAGYRVGTGGLQVNRPKRLLSREYELPAEVVSKLETYLTPRRDKIPALFLGRQGRLTTRRVQTLFDATARAAGVRLRSGQGLQCLRFSIGVHLLERHWDVVEMQEFLGHRDLRATGVFAHIMHRRREWRAM